MTSSELRARRYMSVDAAPVPGIINLDAARGPILWALLALNAMCAGLVAYRWITGAPDAFVSGVLLAGISWTTAVGAVRGETRRLILLATPYFTALLALVTLTFLQVFGDPTDVRHTNALIGAYLTLPIAYLLFFLLRKPREALLAASVTCAVAVALQALFPSALAGRVTTGPWVAALTSIFQGTLLLLFYAVPRLRADRDLLGAILQSARDAVVLLTPTAETREATVHGSIAKIPVFETTLANEAANRFFGLSEGSVLQSSEALADATELHERLAEAQSSRQEVRFSASLKTKDGGALWFKITATPFRGGLAVNFADITEHKEHETRALELAHTDPLTGLANRRGFDAEAKPRTDGSQAHGAVLSLCYLDLNGFKSVNDELGHEAGDALLRQVARRLRNAVRAEDLVARMGGDEFVLLVEGLSSTEVGPYFGRVANVFEEPFVVLGATVEISGSLGVATVSSGLATAMANAEAAMYEAKRRGGGVKFAAA